MVPPFEVEMPAAMLILGLGFIEKVFQGPKPEFKNVHK
jgi:hypothetical protein